MKKTILMSAILFAVTIASAQTTLYSNDFTAGSSGWSFTGGNAWGDMFTVDNTYDCTVPTPNKGGGKYMHVAQDPDLGFEFCAYATFNLSGSAGTSYANMTSDISTVGYSTVTISFSWLCKGNTGGLFDPMYGAVEYSVNSGSSWTRFTSPRTQYLSQTSWTSTTISSDNVPGILNQSKLRVRFVWVNPGVVTGGDPNPAFAIDDIVITGSSGVTCDLESTASSTNVSCNGGSNGSVLLSVTGGTSPFTYLWSNGATTSSFSDVPAGDYSVTVTDANGCTATANASVTEPQALSLEETHEGTTCNEANGLIDLSVTGGTAPYTYLWSNDAVTEDLTGISSGTYTVVVIDANGCSASIGVNIENTSFLCTVPGGVQANEITSTSALIEWNTQLCAYRFKVRYRINGTGAWTTVNVGIGQNYIQLNGLTANTEYEVQVRTRCSADEPAVYTEWSTTQTFTTENACAAPEGVTAVNLRSNRATIIWNTVPAAFSYDVRYRKSGDTEWMRRNITAPDTSRILTNVSSNTAYEYQVRSNCGAAGKPRSTWSDMQTFSTLSRMEEEFSAVTELDIYPNPNKGQFTIQLDNDSMEKCVIEVYNVLGEQILTETVTINYGLNSINIDIRKATHGIYMISIKSEKENFIGKVLIEK